jgi:hypothetical protein
LRHEDSSRDSRGRVEIWPYNYTQASSGQSPTGSSSTFDYDDTAAIGTSGHGTFQLHNLTDTQTVLAWNRSRFNDNPELGFGPCMSGATPCGNPDWTLQTGLSASAFKFQVFIGTTAPSASSLSVSRHNEDSCTIGSNIIKLFILHIGLCPN